MATEPLNGLVVALDDRPLDDLVGPIEVLVQEHLRTFSVAATCTALGELVEIFGARARFGVHGAVASSDVAGLAAKGVDFTLLDTAHEDLLTTCAAAGILTFTQAMTPTEIRSVLDLPVTGAQLFPADVVGHAMAARLKSLGLVDRVVPRGGIGAFAAGEWFKAGARAVCVDSTLVDDALDFGDLAALRDRCASFRKVVPLG